MFEPLIRSGNASADSVKQPYLGLAAATVLLAVLIKLAQLPTVGGEGRIVADAGALRYKHLVLGMIAIFAYIGSEVTVGSNFISFLKLPQLGGFSQTEAKDYLTFFWAGAMVGRFFGAVALAQFRRQVYKYGILVLIIFIAFVVIYGLYGPESGIRMLGLILLNVVVLMLGRFVPQRTLTFFAGSVVVLLGVVATQSGSVALWAIVGIGLFNSIMFPTIFALAIKGLGVYTSQGSSLLVMACVGGATVPPFRGCSLT